MHSFTPRMRLSAFCLAAFLAVTLAPAIATAKTSSRHQVRMYKVQQHVNLADGLDNVVTKTVSCPSNDIATDGMWRIDDVQYNSQNDDEGDYYSGDGGPYTAYNGVDFLAAYGSARDTYTFKLRNNSEDDAQLKLIVTCLGDPTEGAEGDDHKHGFTLNSQQTKTSAALPLGGSTVPTTPANECTGTKGTLVQPGYEFTSGFGKIAKSYPATADVEGWEWGFWIQKAASVVKVSYRCLDDDTATTASHNHKVLMKFRDFNGTKAVDKGFIVDKVSADCGQLEKGLVGAFDLMTGLGGGLWDQTFTGPSAHKLQYVGMDPQIKRRVFRIQNIDTATGYSPKLGVVCVNDRVGKKRF